MTGRAEAAVLDRLKAAAAGVLKADGMPEPVRDRATDVLMADDLLEAIRQADMLHAALEAVSRAAKAGADATDAALLEAMAESGAGSVRLEHHTLSLVETAGRPAVVDRAAVPERFLRPRDPEVDMAAVGRAWRAGDRVPGTEMRNGPPHLRRSARSKG